MYALEREHMLWSVRSMAARAIHNKFINKFWCFRHSEYTCPLHMREGGDWVLRWRRPLQKSTAHSRVTWMRQFTGLMMIYVTDDVKMYISSGHILHWIRVCGGVCVLPMSSCDKLIMLIYVINASTSHRFTSCLSSLTLSLSSAKPKNIFISSQFVSLYGLSLLWFCARRMGHSVYTMSSQFPIGQPTSFVIEQTNAIMKSKCDENKEEDKKKIWRNFSAALMTLCPARAFHVN